MVGEQERRGIKKHSTEGASHWWLALETPQLALVKILFHSSFAPSFIRLQAPCGNNTYRTLRTTQSQKTGKATNEDVRHMSGRNSRCTEHRHDHLLIFCSHCLPQSSELVPRRFPSHVRSVESAIAVSAEGRPGEQTNRSRYSKRLCCPLSGQVSLALLNVEYN